MNFDRINICFEAVSFFEKEKFISFEIANAVLKEQTGVVNFFEKEEDFVQMQKVLRLNNNILAENQIEYGDFQTNKKLSSSICKYLKNKNYWSFF